MGMRVEVDDSNARMNAKIRAAQLQKDAFMLVIGDKEMDGRLVAVRTRHNEDRGALPLASFKMHIAHLVETKSLEL
jgi:threonyl-tRNA synthetase